MDDLGFVESVDRFCESIVIGVADASDGRLDAGFGEALGVFDRDVLSEFKWSSQRLERAAMKRWKRQSDRSDRAALRSPGRPTVPFSRRRSFKSASFTLSAVRWTLHPG